MHPDDLLSLKDDMVAFIEGHGMRRLPGLVTEDIPAVFWEDESNLESWKDFVEMAKSASAPFVTMSAIVLDKLELESLLEEMREEDFAQEQAEEIREAERLQRYAGKTGRIQLGFAHQGIAFIHETTTDWYERYLHLVDFAEGLADLVFGGDDDEE